LFDVYTSGYYAWNKHPHSNRTRANQRLTGLIKQFWLESGAVYGYRKVHSDFRDVGEKCEVNRVYRLMRNEGCKAQVRYRKPRHRSGKSHIVVPNRLQRQFNPDSQDASWVTDITHIRTHERWLYLAVVVDDIAQNISHIIRGYDLLSTTPIHLNLYQALHSQPPVYGHIPVLCEHAGHKLSKQNHARAIDNNNASSNLFFALNVLNLAPPETLVDEPVTTIIDWAVQHWQLSKVPKTAEIVVTTSDSSYHSDP